VKLVLSVGWLPRFGGVPPDLADPPNPFFFLNFRSRVVIGHFPTATWQPMIGPRGNHLLDHVNHCHHPAMSHAHITVQCHFSCQLILPCHHATSLYQLYGLPRGKILLVHGMAQKCQIWVTRGSLWCCHITM
jgi:hypothetical protein